MVDLILYNDVKIVRDKIVNNYRIVLFNCKGIYFTGCGRDLDDINVIRKNAINLLYRCSYFNSVFTSDVVAINRFNELCFIFKKLGGLGGLIR